MECWGCGNNVTAVVKLWLSMNGHVDHLQTQLCNDCWSKLLSGEFSSVSLDEIFTPED